MADDIDRSAQIIGLQFDAMRQQAKVIRRLKLRLVFQSVLFLAVLALLSSDSSGDT